jgi:hypothetical protein
MRLLMKNIMNEKDLKPIRELDEVLNKKDLSKKDREFLENAKIELLRDLIKYRCLDPKK